MSFFVLPTTITPSSLPRKSNIVNPKNHLHRLGRQLDRARADQQGLEDVLLGNIRVDTTALDADAGVLLAVLVPVAQVRHHLDAVQTGVLGKRRGDHLHGVRKRLPADGLGARERARLLGQLRGDLDLGGAATGNERLLLDQAADDAEGVVQRALGLVEDEAVGAADDHGHGLAD